MDETEICIHYKLALDKSYEVQLLSELTDRPRKEIREILVNAGFSPPKRRFRRREGWIERERERLKMEALREQTKARKNQITKAREARNMRRKELAELLGISLSTLSAWEHGRYEPKWDKLHEIFPELKEGYQCR